MESVLVGLTIGIICYCVSYLEELTNKARGKMKIKHNCKKCADWSRGFAGLGKEFAEKCRCEK